MLHEWGHLVLYRVSYPARTEFPTSLTAPPVLDEKAVDYWGNELGTPGNRPGIYGWGRVTQTARYYPDRVRKTPDAHVMFSMAVYYTEINTWGLQYVTGRGRYYSQS